MLKLFNTFKQQKEEFQPLEANKVKMYVCGPTVYDYAHLGHARCYITWDVLYRYLKFKGYEVTYCRNVTDVDDKILNRAAERNIAPQELSEQYYQAFTKSMADLNLLKPDIEPYATKTIGEMIAMIKKLIEKGHAYQTGGDVYFRVKSYPKYGELSGQPLDDLMSGKRVATGEIKENDLDFALWKNDEKFGYQSPWGTGRPGWHIECSAMSKKFLGDSIDIHAGGADLAFPHHENERAQSECANCAPFVKYWLHNGFVTINKEKMSKSLNNFLTVDELLKSHDANVIRFFILTNHYRMPVEFNDDALNSAAAGVKRLQNAIAGVSKFVDGSIEVSSDSEAIQEFIEAMDDDLNTSKALALLFDLAGSANKAKDEGRPDNAKYFGSVLIYLFNVLGFKMPEIELSQEELALKVSDLYDEFDIPKDLSPAQLLNQLIDMRNLARLEKNYELSDKIRNSLDKSGIILKDSKESTTYELKK